jgi:hypothetical protein
VPSAKYSIGTCAISQIKAECDKLGRGSPMVLLTVHQLDKEDIFQDMVRIHPSHRSGIGAGRICRVTAIGVTVLAAARGSPSNRTDGIWLDDAMRKHLGVKEDEQVDFKIARARWFEEFTWMWNAADPASRAAGRLGLISFALGVIGFALGIITLLR